MISIKDIKNTLSEFTYNLGNLCKSNKVNKWSEHKPVNSPKLTPLSNQDYYDIDCGYNITTFMQPQLMLNALQDSNTNLWEYIARESPYRISDFDQYDHNTVAPLQLNFVNMNSGKVGDVLHIGYTGDIQHIVNNYATFRNASSTADLVLLIFERGKQYDQSGTQSVYIYKVCQLLDFDGERIPLKISNDLQVGDYTAVPCMSSATYRFEAQETYRYNPNSEIIAGVWYPFPPHAKVDFSVTTTSPSTSDYFNYFSVDMFTSVDFTYTNYNYELRDITFTNYVVYSPPSRTKQFTVTIEYYYTNCAQPVLLGQMSRTFNFDNTLETATINYRDVITVITSARLEEDIISLEQRVHISSGGETQHKIFSRTLEK